MTRLILDVCLFPVQLAIVLLLGAFLVAAAIVALLIGAISVLSAAFPKPLRRFG